MTTPTLTLTGFLGGDREIRWTEERTTTRTRWNEVAEMDEEYEVTTPARAYAVLSLAMQQQVSGRWQTVWHRLLVWDVYQTMATVPVWIARKGDQVRVTGHLETATFAGRDSRPRTVTQLIVESFSILQSRTCRQQGYRPRRPRPAMAACTRA